MLIQQKTIYQTYEFMHGFLNQVCDTAATPVAPPPSLRVPPSLRAVRSREAEGW